MNGVLGHFYALSRLNWAGDNLGGPSLEFGVLYCLTTPGLRKDIRRQTVPVRTFGIIPIVANHQMRRYATVQSAW